MAPLGVVVGAPKLDLAAMMKHKDETVAANVAGVAFLFKKNKIDWVVGEGRIAAPGKVVVKGADGKETTLEAKAIVIATGSDVARLPGVEIDEKTVVSSTGALALAKPPKKLIVVGAGVIGLELGSVWRRFGAEVTVVEFLDRILPGMDGEVAKQFQRMLERQGFKFHLGHKVRASKERRRRQGDDRARRRRRAEHARGRRRARRDRPAALHRGARARGARRRDGARPGRHRRAFRDQRRPASTRSATSCAGRCSPTRPRTKASRSPKSSPARRAT